MKPPQTSQAKANRAIIARTMAILAAAETSIPIQVRSLPELRCPACGRLAGRVAGPAEIACSKCGRMVTAA